jgi:hypothetical protein
VNLPLSGSPGIDPRSGGSNGNHQVIVNFAHAIDSSSASITSGSGNIASYTVAGTQAIVNLTGVANGETLVIRLNEVNDGAVTGPVNVRLTALLGDTNGNGVVNASDVAETKAQSGQPATNINFRTDVTVSGVTNATDIGVVKAQIGLHGDDVASAPLTPTAAVRVAHGRRRLADDCATSSLSEARGLEKKQRVPPLACSPAARAIPTLVSDAQDQVRPPCPRSRSRMPKETVVKPRNSFIPFTFRRDTDSADL